MSPEQFHELSPRIVGKGASSREIDAAWHSLGRFPIDIVTRLIANAGRTVDLPAPGRRLSAPGSRGGRTSSSTADLRARTPRHPARAVPVLSAEVRRSSEVRRGSVQVSSSQVSVTTALAQTQRSTP